MDKNNNFTMVRIMAAFMVIVGHEFVLWGWAPPVLMGIDIHGLGVRILFLVSGYLVSSSYMRSHNIGQYLKKRLIRLYPALIVCLLLTVFFMMFLTKEQPEIYLKSAWAYLWRNTLMSPKFDLAGVFSTNVANQGVNGSLWTLPIELICYFLIIPVIEFYKVTKKYLGKYDIINAAIILVLLSLADTIRELFYPSTVVAIWGIDVLNAISLVLWFVFGAFFYTFELKRFCNWEVGILIAVIYICLPSAIKYIFAPYVIGYEVFCFSLSDKAIFKKAIKHDICYGLYLYAFPVQQVIISFMWKKNVTVMYGAMALSIIVTIALAEMSYFVVEKNVNKLMK